MLRADPHLEPERLLPRCIIARFPAVGVSPHVWEGQLREVLQDVAISHPTAGETHNFKSPIGLRGMRGSMGKVVPGSSIYP